MTRSLVQRLCLVPLIGFIVVTLVFVLLRAVPGSAVDVLSAQAIGLTTEQRAELIHDLNLDDSLVTQYVAYLRALPELDLGLSFYSGRDVTNLLGDALPATIELALAAMLFALVLGVLTGAIAARTRGRWPDSLIRFFSTLTFSLPWFALGVLAIIVFGVVLEWLPIFGRLPAGAVYEPTTGFVLVDAFVQWDFSVVGPWLEHLTLPALTLGLTMTGFLTRITRAAVLETMAEPYIRTARMVGLRDREILVHHVMRNASIPILTVAGLQFGALLGGAVITEVVFAYPGVGSLLVTAILQHDYFVAQGAALAVGLLFTVVSGVVDVGALALDPRLRHA